MSKEDNAKKGWRDIPIGGLITESGNAEKYHTGSWRIKRPLWSREKCIQCLFCWAYCPDLAIEVEDGLVIGVDYAHCKGCGICANQCPAQALEMISEDKSDVNDDKAEVDHEKKTE
ncbi:MAG: 4Fe-4S binding protein [Halanaerobiales bacterium]|nr:4Fe-4S binding protein [Halanaerobiales bacterium]